MSSSCIAVLTSWPGSSNNWATGDKGAGPGIVGTVIALAGVLPTRTPGTGGFVGAVSIVTVTDFPLGRNGFDGALRTDALVPADFGPASATRRLDLAWLFGPAVLCSADLVRSAPWLALDAEPEVVLSAHAAPSLGASASPPPTTTAAMNKGRPIARL